jgi:hypothetical protein
MTAQSFYFVGTLTASGPDQIPDADCSHIRNDQGEYDMNVFLASGEQDLKNAILWTKTVPGFADLGWEDKVCLIRASWMDLILLRLSYRSIGYPKGTTVFGRSLVMSHSEVKKMGWSQGMLDDHDEFTDKLRILNPDRNEFACLCALVLLTSGMSIWLFTLLQWHLLFYFSFVSCGTYIVFVID